MKSKAIKLKGIKLKVKQPKSTEIAIETPTETEILNNNMLDNYPDLLTVNDLIEILRIGRNTAYDIIKENRFPVIKIKSNFRIPKKSFSEWLQQNHTID